MPQLDLIPNVQAVRAVVTTRWNGKAYRPLGVNSIEQYYIDTALDNDSDVWTLDFGDPEGKLTELLKRDNEVRAQLYGVGNKLGYIMTGVADDANFQDGTWTLTGRDLSSLAVDSTVLPHRWNKARAWAIVDRQAREIGFHDTQLAHTKMVRKAQYTDGSESYWDFWYRLYRQEKMWLWTTPRGVLVGDKLNYGSDAYYFIGDSRSGDSDSIQKHCIPVIGNVLTKTTQNRVWEVVVYGKRGQDGFQITERDPTMKHWIKRPRKVMLSSDARTVQAAKRDAWEEIFEGKVGSVEFKITIPDPGFIVQQNKVARLYLKDIGVFGHYFVVGSRIQGGPDGFVQEIRLRELEYAVSKRVPTAPKLVSGGPGKGKGSGFGKSIETDTGAPHGWGDYFAKAAKRYHGVVDYDLFLACLLGICDAESSFKNVREGGGPAWHPFDPSHQVPIVDPVTGIDQPPIPVPTATVANDKKKWQRQFANAAGADGNPYKREAGVGPMQLTSVGIKQSADDLMNPGHRSQYNGGRWHPEFNIMLGARTLHNGCEYFHVTTDDQIWEAVDAYNLGEQGARDYFRVNNHVSSYAAHVRQLVLGPNGYLTKVKKAVQDTPTPTSSKDFTDPFPNGWKPNRLDMGWDGTFNGKIVAPFEGIVQYAGVAHGWKNSGMVVIRATKKNLPIGTQSIFFAEGLEPTVKSGDIVHVGQRIAWPVRNPYNGIVGNIEWGPAAEGKTGVQPNTYVLTGISNRRQAVLDFVDWAQGTLHVPGEPTDRSGAGYP